MNKTVLIISLVFISMLAISAVSAADNATDVISDVDDSDVVAVVGEDDVVNADVDDSDVVAVVGEDDVVSADVVEKENVISKDSGSENLASDDSNKLGDSGNGSSSSGKSSGIDFASLFNGTSFSFGNGTTIDFSSLLNGTFTTSNGTFNISDLLNGNFSFGNGSSFNISSILNRTSTNGTFDFSSILDIFGGKNDQETITASDLTKIYTASTKFSVTVMKGNQTLNTGTVIFTIDNKELIGHIGSGGVATVTIPNLKAGTHFIISEYGGVMVKNIITVKKATPKLTAKAKTFKAKVKTKKYSVTLKTNENKALKNTKVTIKVKGKTYSAKTNSKGKATFKITKLTKKGKFTATVKSANTDCFKSVSKKVQIKVK